MALTITQRTRSRIALVSGVLLVVALGAAQLAAPVGTAWRDGALITASVLAGFPIAVRAWAALRAKAFSIDLLVTIGVAALRQLHHDGRAVQKLFEDVGRN